MTDEVTIGPTRAQIRKDIIAEVLAEYDIDLGTLMGPVRTDNVVDARVAAAHRLRGAGFSISQIARILHRDHTVICYYFDDVKRQNSRDRQRLKRQTRLLPDDVRVVIDEFAKAKGIAPYMVIREWVNERARFESEAKARAAA